MSTSPTRKTPEATRNEGSVTIDRTAFARWYDDRFPTLCAFAIRLGAAQDAEDVVHDVLVRWLATPNGGHMDKLPADSYWYAAVKNRVNDLASHGRVVQRWLESQHRHEPSVWWGPDAVLMANELAATVNGVLLSLPQHTRDSFDLVKARGMSYDAASEVLGLTPKAVRRRVERAVEHIRREITY